MRKDGPFLAWAWAPTFHSLADGPIQHERASNPITISHFHFSLHVLSIPTFHTSSLPISGRSLRSLLTSSRINPTAHNSVPQTSRHGRTDFSDVRACSAERVGTKISSDRYLERRNSNWPTMNSIDAETDFYRSRLWTCRPPTRPPHLCLVYLPSFGL